MRPLYLSLSLLVICGVNETLNAATILSENFDALTQSLDVTTAGAFGSINGTNVDVVGIPSFNLCRAPESGNCIDLNGTFGNPQGQLQSNMLFAPGNYLLSYDLIGSHRGVTASATVTFGNYNQSYTLASADVTSGIVVNQPVTLTTPGYLTFASNTTGDMGLVLDNVVVAGAMTVPEPSSLVLMASGLLAGLVLLRDLRRRAA